MDQLPAELPGNGMDKYRALLGSGVTGMWAGVPGLYNKWFPIGPDGANSAAGMYVFRTKQQCDEYMKGELWGSMGKMPHFTNLKFECLEILEGSIHTVGLGEWPQEYC